MEIVRRLKNSTRDRLCWGDLVLSLLFILVAVAATVPGSP